MIIQNQPGGTAGSYNNVKITATYPGPDGKPVTTDVANCAVAINDSRSIKVLVGSDVPSVDSVLNLPSTWEAHTASWTTSPNTNSTNEGVITIHYPASDLDQQIKVYVTVIPKTTAVDGQNFFTNGEKYDGTTGSIANGNNQGAILTQANGQAIDYTTYSGQKTPGEQTVYDTKTTSYTPTYSLSGLETNSDGSLVSGVQTATVRVSVPQRTIGAKVDTDGNYYYEVKAKVNIAQKVNFEFVDEYKNDQVVGQPYSQEFIPGVATNLNFNMAMPDGYELGNGASIPSQYTLAAFSQTTPVVQVPIHQKMHFYITFHDEDSNTNLGTVEVSGSAAAGTGGYYPSINTKLTFPAGANAGDYYSVSTSGVPDGVQLLGSYGVPLTDPKADWTTPNYRWENTFSVLKALTGATMTINLKHKINTTQERQTRTATVNYVKAKVNADGTYTQDGSAAQSAVLDVYYSRKQYQDQVTKVKTYSPWLWDTKQGQNGYHVESGTWTSLPQSWGAVVADVPTLDGYTAATVTDQSGQPANQFVYPTWNKAGTSDEGKESLAYTENAPIYEARPVHTVLYIPNEQQARTITSKYVIAGGNKNGQQFAPDSQIQIFYDRTGTLNVANNTITYGNWQWDNTAGDRATPGFHVISGSWSLPTDETSSWQVNIPNSGNDYVVANLRYDGAYSTFTLAAPSYNANDVFTSPTSDQWFTRNTLVTYYVPTSMVNKTVTRTIKISEPGQDSKTITQTVKLTRQVRVNQDDTGVVYDGFAGSGWSTGNWAAQDVPTHGGYTMYATQTVNGVTTPIQLVNGQIPAETVNGTSQDTTINITWGAVATATLTGTGTSTYNGQAITNAELNNALKVNVTGPTAGAGTYTLQAGDVEFSIDGTNWTTALPINAGNYQVRLTAQGKNGIIGKYGNNSIIWTQNGQSTITSNATYMINKLADNAVMANAQSGNYEMTYNGAAPSTIDPSKYQLAFTNWLPTDVPVPNLTWKDNKLLNNDNDTGLTWTVGDLYVEGYPDGGVPTNVGTYRVKISKQLTDKLRQLFPDYDFSGNIGENGVDEQDNEEIVEPSHTPASYVITPANTTVKITGAQHVKYGESTNINVGDYSISITAPVHNETVDNNAERIYTNVTLAAGDLEFVTVPTNVGTYQVKLSAQGLQKLKDLAGSSNYDWTQAANAKANFFVEQMPVTIAVSGQSSVTYGTQDWLNAIKVNPSGYVLTITTENGAALSYHTVDGDLVFNQTPGNVGEYQVELSAQGLANIEEKLGTNYSYPQTAADVTAKGTFTVKQGEVTVTLNGSDGKTYNAVPTLSSGLNLDKYNVTYSATVYSADGKAQTLNLTANDLQIIGNATNVGTYQVELSQAGQEKLEQLTGNNGANYKWTFKTNADYVVKAATASAELSGSNQKTFDGSAVTTAEVNSNGQILVHLTYPGSNVQSTYTLQDGDYTWETEDGQTISAPTNTGTYTIKLNKQAILVHLQAALNQQAGLGDNDQSNLTVSADKLSGQASFKINPQTLTDVTISAPDQSKTYDAQAADLDVNGITITANGIVANNPLVNPGISASDFTWYDETGNKLESAPVDVGTYQARLNASTLAELQNTNPNYQFSSVAGLINYTINPAPATAKISGSADRDYNTQTTSVSDVMNNIKWKATGLVTDQELNLTGLTANSYAWYSKDADGNYVAMTGNPVNAGTYYLRLTKDAIAQVKADNSNYNFTSVDGEFTYTINVVNGTATLSGSSSKTYDGQAATTAEVNSTNGDIIVNFAFPGSSAQSTYALQAGDYIWENKDGQEISAPTNAGTYYISLTANGLKKLQADNPNYAISESGQFTYVISPAEENVTISGSQESISTSIDNANFTVHAPAGITVPTGMTYEFATGVPSESGVYVIKLTPESIAALEKTNPNYKLNISSDARFTLDATLSIEFEDTQDGNKQVGKTITKTGVANSTINDLKLVVPDNYELAPDQELPTSYTFGKTLNQNLYIKLVHKLNELNPTDPSTNPHPTNKNWFRENGLVKDVTRTINYEGLSTAQLAQIPETQKAQTVEFTRTAKYDLVTGKIVVNSEGSWTAVDGKDIFAGFTPFAFAGYTAAPAKVEQVKVTGNDKNSQITVTYTANNQTGKISYVDSDGKEVGQTTISGKTGETVKVTPEAPTGWQIVSGQDIPETVVATPTGVPTVVVKVTHSTITVTPETPEKDIPTGPVPGDPSKNYEKMESITASPTRTIVVTDPSGRTTKVTQTVNFTRTATFDEVTGEITYSNWASSEPTEWSEYTAPEVAGYTATSSVSAKTVTAETADEMVNISYTANNQTGKISYVDSQGNEVGQTALTGKTDQSVAVTPEAPTGWIIVAGQDIPKSVTATATGIPTVTVRVEHSTTIVTPKTPEKDIPTGPVPGDPSKNYEKMESLTASPTRTIVVTDPSGKTTKVTQTVNFTRTATFDEVTGEITYSNWASSEPTEWSEYTAPEVAGYTATSSVSAKTVTAETADEMVNISYTANNQTGKISYVDSQGNEVGQTALTGKTDQSVAVTPEAPSGWRIVSGQDIPKSVTATATGIPTVTVKVEHSTTIVTPETPEKDIPTGPVPGDPSKDYEKMESLTASPTRTIVVTDPSGKTTEVTQTVNFTRMATFDEVTGEITYSDWISSEPTEWPEYTAPEVAGYTATSSVSAKPVTAETRNETVSISYTANSQTGKISYVDGDGKEVGQTTISGKTGETVNVTPQVPSGWKIVPGQDIPKTITISENGISTVTVKVEHSTIIVTPETPEKDIPTGPVSGDPSKDYEKMESLTASPTRTIVVTDPSGRTAKVTQTVNFTRMATFDEVTGEVTYSDWQLEKSTSANHTAQWDSYTPQFITHYVPSIAEVPAEEVNANTADRQVTITYTPASESQVIRYVDQNGKEISTQIVSGKYGLDTTFTPKLPNNWQAANTIPTSIKIGENGGLTTIVVEAKTEKVQQSKTVTETIHYHTANGKQIVADKEMKVNFTRTGVKNLVTGEITWNSWNNAEEIFNEVPSPKVSGYTASPAKVAAQTVTPNSEDLVFNVIYTKNSQTYPTIPENKPNKPQEENVSKQETKTQDKLIHEYGYKKRADGRLVDHTGHVYPASSKVKENGAIYSEKGELLSVGSRRKHELPQTGLHDNSLIAAIGSLLAGISIFGLLGGRKKKDDDK